MKPLISAIVRLTEIVGALAVALLVLLLFANIVAREVLSISLVWANEVSLALFAWAIFLGAAVAFSRGARIRFTFIVDRLPSHQRSMADVATTWIGTGVLLILLAISMQLLKMSWNQQMTSIPVSMGWHMAGLPAGTLVAILGWLAGGPLWCKKEEA